MSDEQNRELDQELEALKALLDQPEPEAEDFALEDIIEETAAMAEEEALTAEEEAPAAEAEAPAETAPEAPEAPQEKKGSRLRRSILYYALMAVFAGIFIFCAVEIADWAVDAIERNSAYGDLAEQIDQLKDNLPHNDPLKGTLPGGETLPSGSGSSDSSGILPEYQALYEMNNDLVGWIKIEGTNVNYPVMQTAPDNRDYYLYRDFSREWNAGGSIYAREECDVFTPSDNVVLYGHSMQDLSMFQNIKKFNRKSFWEEHQYIQFDTIYERHTYQVIACFKTTANPGEGFSYHLFNTAANEEEFNSFISTVHELEFYDTGLTAEYGDMLLTLSTCEYTLNNGRLVVVAKRIS